MCIRRQEKFVLSFAFLFHFPNAPLEVKYYNRVGKKVLIVICHGSSYIYGRSIVLKCNAVIYAIFISCHAASKVAAGNKISFCVELICGRVLITECALFAFTRCQGAPLFAFYGYIIGVQITL